MDDCNTQSVTSTHQSDFTLPLTSKSMDSTSISAICGSVFWTGEEAREGRLELLAFAEGGIDDIWKASRVNTDMMRVCLSRMKVLEGVCERFGCKPGVGCLLLEGEIRWS